MSIQDSAIALEPLGKLSEMSTTKSDDRDHVSSTNKSLSRSPSSPPVDDHSADFYPPEIESHLNEVEAPPDGGYGWVIVAVCSIGMFFFSGTSYSFGVVQAALVREGVAGPATLAFVGSLSVAFISVLAIPNSMLIRRFGARTVFGLGGLIMGLGEILASFAIKSVPGLFITFGLVVGVGYGMIYMTAVTLPPQYFVRKRGLAIGIVNAAGGLGGAVNAIVLAYMVQTVGTAWCFRILGLVSISAIVPAAYFIVERGPKRSPPGIQWRLFKDIRFATIFVASAIATFPLMVPPFFLPLYGAEFGLSTISSAALASGFNLASAAGRVMFGQLADWLGPVNVLILAMCTNGFALLVLWPISTTLAPLIVFAICSGISAGGFFSLMPTTIASLTDPAIMTSGFGLLVTGWGAGYLLGPPIAGYLLQAVGGANAGVSAYRPAMFYAGSLTIASMLMIAGMRWKTAKNIRMRM